MNSFLNVDSTTNGHNPSSLSFGAIAEPMLIMLMVLNVLEQTDWKPAVRGKNLICNFRLDGREYTLVRKGTSKEIITFYPKNDNQNVPYVELERNLNKNEVSKKPFISTCKMQ